MTEHFAQMFPGKNTPIGDDLQSPNVTDAVSSSSVHVIPPPGIHSCQQPSKVAAQDLVSWRTKKQTHVALSSAEAEYIAASFACRQVVSVKSLLQFLYKFTEIPVIYEDNKAAIQLAKSLEQKALKHVVQLCFHHIRFEVVNRNVRLVWVPSKENVADVFTKPLPELQFVKFRDELVKQEI